MAFVVIGRWYWVHLGPGGSDQHRGGRTWKELYREALVGRESGAVASRLTEAEEAIKYELLTHPFTTGAERQSLQDALSNLRVLRDNTDALGGPQIKHAMVHRSTKRHRTRHFWNGVFLESL